MKRLLGLAIFGGVGFLAYKAYAAAETVNAVNGLQASLAGVRFKQFDASGFLQGKVMLRMEALLRLKNSANSELQIELINLDIKGDNGLNFGDVALSTVAHPELAPRFRVPALDTVEVPVPIATNLLQLLGAAGVNAIIAGKKNLKQVLPKAMNVEGSIRANGFSVGVKQTVPFSNSATPQA